MEFRGSIALNRPLVGSLDGSVRPRIAQRPRFAVSRSNDPNDPVNGVDPIGDWICRGQHGNSPFEFFTQYYKLNNGTLITEGHSHSGGRSAVMGGFGSFSGASGPGQSFR
jgi:hypothetical protein